MLLPTQLYIVGGAAVVVLTFVVMIFVVRQPLSGQHQILEMLKMKLVRIIG
jgi:hypothetical protein